MTQPEAPRHSDLPLPDFDHLPIGSLATRIRSLDADQLSIVLAYEKQHGDRLPVVQVIQERLDELEAGAEPTHGSPAAARPEMQQGPEGGDRVTPQTAGPPITPPSHGGPTNPA
jgi:hypothetical protein